MYTLLYVKWIAVKGLSVAHGVSVCVLSFCVCLTLSVLMDCSLPAPLSMEFSSQEYWSGLLFPSPGDLPSTRNKPTTLLTVMWLPCQDGSVGRMDTCMCTGESLSCSPETIPTRFVNQLYPIQNKKVFQNRLFFSWSSWSYSRKKIQRYENPNCHFCRAQSKSRMPHMPQHTTTVKGSASHLSHPPDWPLGTPLPSSLGRNQLTPPP